MMLENALNVIYTIMNIKTPFRKKRKTVRFNSKENTTRTLSAETKKINYKKGWDILSSC